MLYVLFSRLDEEENRTDGPVNLFFSSFRLPMMWCGSQDLLKLFHFRFLIHLCLDGQHANQLAQHGNDLFPLSLLGAVLLDSY